VLGDLIYEARGKITGYRVLDVEGPKIEVTISENGKLKGEIDMSGIFIGSDPAFYGWCNDLFDHYWERGGYFDIRKTTIV
jgi:hypothetical protein